MPDDNLVFLHNAKFRWPGEVREILSIPEFTIERGQNTFIQGPSGSGKSTLLNLIGGVIQPQSGTVFVAGNELSRISTSACDRVRANELGFIFQQFNLIPYLNALENVLLPCEFSRVRKQRILDAGETPPEQAEKILGALFQNQVPDLTRPVYTLSVGQQQRVAAARALLGSPPLIVADEPTSSLDYDNRQLFMDLLFRQCENYGATLLFVSHDPTLKDRFSIVLDFEAINLGVKE